MSIPDYILATLRPLNDLDLGALAFAVGAQTPAIMAALATIGEAWLAALPDVAAGMAAIDRSLVLDGAVWRPWDIEGRAAFPDGLNLAEALGATFVMRWADGWQQTLRLSLPVARAMLVLRRAAFPAIPWRPRDPIAEDLQRRIRAMEVADLDSRTLADALTLTKPLRIALGWAWSSDATPPEQVIAGAVAALDNAAGAAALGKPDEPITVARALLKQAASTVDLADRLALVTEARQWAALDR